MNKYTHNNIIIYPASEKAKNCIGKMVYFADSPSKCLSYANNNDNEHCEILREINVDRNSPFLLNSGFWDCIILRNEELEPEYVPFKDYGEFIRYYVSSTSDNSLDSKIFSLGGIWLKWKGIDVFHMVTEIWGKGVVIGNKKLNTLSKPNNEYYTTNEITTWDELLEEYTFLDGSPCGKEVRTIHL